MTVLVNTGVGIVVSIATVRDCFLFGFRLGFSVIVPTGSLVVVKIFWFSDI